MIGRPGANAGLGEGAEVRDGRHRRPRVTPRRRTDERRGRPARAARRPTATTSSHGGPAIIEQDRPDRDFRLGAHAEPIMLVVDSKLHDTVAEHVAPFDTLVRLRVDRHVDVIDASARLSAAASPRRACTRRSSAASTRTSSGARPEIAGRSSSTAARPACISIGFTGVANHRSTISPGERGDSRRDRRQMSCRRQFVDGHIGHEADEPADLAVPSYQPTSATCSATPLHDVSTRAGCPDREAAVRAPGPGRRRCGAGGDRRRGSRWRRAAPPTQPRRRRPTLCWTPSAIGDERTRRQLEHNERPLDAHPDVAEAPCRATHGRFVPHPGERGEGCQHRRRSTSDASPGRRRTHSIRAATSVSTRAVPPGRNSPTDAASATNKRSRVPSCCDATTVAASSSSTGAPCRAITGVVPRRSSSPRPTASNVVACAPHRPPAAVDRRRASDPDGGARRPPATSWRSPRLARRSDPSRTARRRRASGPSRRGRPAAAA